MRVHISETGTLRLHAAEDLAALSVRVEGDVPDWTVLAPTLRAAGDHAWLDVSWLRTAAGERDQDWHDGFTAMLGHAAARGWLSADGDRVRAHIDRRQTHDD
jgi:hypothetical protein